MHVVPKKGGFIVIRNEKKTDSYKNCDRMEGVY